MCAAIGCYSGIQGNPGGSGDDASDSGPGDGSEGGDDSGETGEPDEVGCGGAAPVIIARPLHRLSPVQYNNTVRALFGDAMFEASYDDEEYVPTERGVRQFRDDARTIIDRKAEWTTEVFGCDTSGAANAQCAEDFVDTFGSRVFRRPLTDAERGRLLDTYDAANAEFGFSDAMDIVLQAMLQSTPFLYLTEEGTAVEGVPNNIRQLTDHEVASRLSYFLWDTMPDDELFAAANAGELTTREGLRAQAERLINSPQAEAKIQRFVWEWLQLDGGTLHHALEESDKDPVLFPEYSPALQDAMRTELEAFVQEVVLDSDDASIETLFTSTRAYVNGPMATLYGVGGGPMDDETWTWVDLADGERAGLLTRAAFLTVFSALNVQSPIRRGTYVVEELLCTELGTPPPNVDDSPPQGGDVDGETLTVREDVEARTQGVECQGCHAVINPAGFLFEHYDAIGRWQANEVTSGLPIDSSGELVVSDAEGDFADAVQMSAALSTSTKVRECFADRWLVDATGAAVDDLDECGQEDILTTFLETGDIRELIVSIVVSDNFRYLNTQAEE